MWIEHFPYSETYDPHAYTFRAECIWCATPKTITLPAEQLFEYRRGALVQNAFPEMSAEDREFIISGVCPACFDTLREDEPEDEITSSGSPLDLPTISNDYPVKDDWCLIYYDPSEYDQ